MGVRAVFRADAGLVVTGRESPLAPFEAEADGLTVRITAQTQEVTELLGDDEDGQPIYQRYVLIESVEGEVEAAAGNVVIAPGTIPNELYERLRSAAAAVLGRTLAWLRDSADDMDVDVRLRTLKLVGFDDGSGYREGVRIVGRPNRLLQDAGGVLEPAEWPSITERVRRHEDVPVERALLVLGRADEVSEAGQPGALQVLDGVSRDKARCRK